MKKIKIKFCGFTRKKDLKKVILYQVNAIGLIFYKKSPRFISILKSKELLKNILPFVNIVGVFVNPTFKEIKNIINNIPLSLIQFHGYESPIFCKNISEIFKIFFIKTIHIKKNNSYKLLDFYKKYKSDNYFFSSLLLDTFNIKYGGTGKTFNWKIIPKKIKKNIIISGGINYKNINKIIFKIKPYAIDLSSGIEKNKGIKDFKKIENIIKIINSKKNEI